MVNDTDINETKQKIAQSDRIAVFSHIRPDGDAVGSLLAVGLALEAIGKNIQMILLDGVPDNFLFLMGSEKISTTFSDPVDMTIVVDCSEKERVGKAFPDSQTPDVNIDHHITNRNFGSLNLVDSNAAASAEIIYNLLLKLALPVTPGVRDALLTGILTDTIGFRTSNVSSTTLRIAADLTELGADLPSIYKQVLASRSFQALRYWGFGLKNLFLEDRIVWSVLTLEAREKSSYSGHDDADLINILSAMQGVDIAVVFIEQFGESVKISWRAQNGFDVSEVAEHFGGGGHRAASGAEIRGNLLEVKELVLRKTREILK